MRTERIGFALCGSFCNHPKIFENCKCKLDTCTVEIS